MPTSPVLFLKPSTSYVQEPHPIICPKSVELHHEVELGVIIGKQARDVSKMAAMTYVGGYCLALDMTARNLQDVAKKGGLPWTLAKGQDTWCAVSPYIAVKDIPDPANVGLRLDVDGAIRQDGNTRDMIFSVPDLIEYISKHMTLEEGDVILTGTPAGVGPVKPGQTINASLTVGGKIVQKMNFKVEEKVAKL